MQCNQEGFSTVQCSGAQCITDQERVQVLIVQCSAGQCITDQEWVQFLCGHEVVAAQYPVTAFRGTGRNVQNNDGD